MEKINHVLKKYPIIGVCGLDCGLCPRYYTEGTSRCPGCCGPDFFNKHPLCSFITCCVKKKKLEVCSECTDFPCPKFKTNEEYQQLKQLPTFPQYKKVMQNFNFIKKYGIKKFVGQLNERINILEIMIKYFDDGRSKSYFCKASALLDIKILKTSIDKAIQKIKNEKIDQNDFKKKAKILKTILDEISKE